MGRVLIIAVAVLLGTASAWFFVPAVPLAKVTDEPSAGSKVAQTDRPMSAKERRMRAEHLIGQSFKYISSDEVHSTSWFTGGRRRSSARWMNAPSSPMGSCTCSIS